MEMLSHFLTYIGKGFIKAYQLCISPWMANHCRFYPTCSQYAEMAIEQYGFWYGIFLTLGRLLRCHPGCQGGYDPVPEQSRKN